MKIAILYGHVASNIGDLAINQGQINLLLEIYPHAKFHIVFLDAAKNEFMNLTRSSFNQNGVVSFTNFSFSSEKGLSYLYEPEAFLKDCEAADADMIVLSAGEHLFRYKSIDNLKSFFCRTFPALAAKATGKKCVIMPSTFGPFEDVESVNVMKSLLSLADSSATRDTFSTKLLTSSFNATMTPELLDPAFFLNFTAPNPTAKKQGKTLGLVMRSENWGIRLVNTAKNSTQQENTLAYQFAFQVGRLYLNNKNNKLIIFIQTIADQELAELLFENLAKAGFAEQIEMYRPLSVQDYLDKLNCTDQILASRFHAIILGLVVGKQVYGTYFETHGYKMPGLFDLLKASSYCLNLSLINPEKAAELVQQMLFNAQQTNLLEEIKILKEKTTDWLKTSLTRPLSIAQLQFSAKSFGVFATKFLLDNLRNRIKKQYDGIKATSEAQQKILQENITQLEFKLSQANEHVHKQALESFKVITELKQHVSDVAANAKQQHEEHLLKISTLEKERDALTNLKNNMQQIEDRLRQTQLLAEQNTQKFLSVQDDIQDFRTSVHNEVAAVTAAAQRFTLENTEVLQQDIFSVKQTVKNTLQQTQLLAEQNTQKFLSVQDDIQNFKTNIHHELEEVATAAQRFTLENTRALQQDIFSVKQTVKNTLQQTQLLAEQNTQKFLSVQDDIQNFKTNIHHELEEVATAAQRFTLENTRALQQDIFSVKQTVEENSQAIGDYAACFAKQWAESEHQLADIKTEIEEQLAKIKQENQQNHAQNCNKILQLEQQIANLHVQQTQNQNEANEVKIKLTKLEKAIAKTQAQLALEQIKQSLNFTLLQKQHLLTHKSQAAAPKAKFRSFLFPRKNKNSANYSEAELQKLQDLDAEKLFDAYKLAGLSGFQEALSVLNLPAVGAANSYTRLAKQLIAAHPADAASAAKMAYELDPKPFRAKWLAFRLHACGETMQAAAILKNLPEDIEYSASEQMKIEEIFMQERRLGNPNARTSNATAAFAPETLIETYQKGGSTAMLDLLRAQEIENKKIALSLLQVGKVLWEADLKEAEVELATLAVTLDYGASSLRGLFWAAQRAMKLDVACDTIMQLDKLLANSSEEGELKKLAALKKSPSYQLATLKLIPAHRAMAITPIKNRVCYILHNSLPYSSGGYATRSHGVAGGLAAAGYQVIVLTRPGYPLDVNNTLDANEINLIDTIDSITYVRTLSPSPKNKSFVDYIAQSAEVLIEQFKKYHPSVVIAASNHRVALPALIAARTLGIPFIYEVRGWWEITRLSRENTFSETASFHVQTTLESATAKNADFVFTLTEPMREKLLNEGVAPEKLGLLPNSCDPARFVPCQKDTELAQKLNIPASMPVIGYVGTFVDYEGLEDLAAACGILKSRGVQFRLLLVGNENTSGNDRGPITEKIMQSAEDGEFSEWLIMPGRVPHEEVEKYYSLIDIAPFPRKPWTVCEMVSPMKPLEALAMEKAVVVSSVRALIEMIQHEKTGLVFEKGNISHLADTLVHLINSPELRKNLGKQGRIWVKENRTWKSIGELAANILSPITSGPSFQEEVKTNVTEPA
ncbi:glycosyltransferase [Legionella septentrionalis]|nr:polysaccharide pyruvyl transferase family protein [Legionella septentrionalis]